MSTGRKCQTLLTGAACDGLVKPLCTYLLDTTRCSKMMHILSVEAKQQKTVADDGKETAVIAMMRIQSSKGRNTH